MGVNDFDRIAPLYDHLVCLTFGKSLMKCQTVHLNRLDKRSNILVLGGGSGNILPHLPIGASITYIDKSEKMIELAKGRKTDGYIEFLAIDFLDFNSSKNYDAIICPFFLDCFDRETLQAVLIKIKALFKSGGHLIVADFDLNYTPWLIGRGMHAFFKKVARLQSSQLQPIDGMIVSNSMKLVERKYFLRKMIFSAYYRNL